MSLTQLLARMWRVNQASVMGPIAKITDENARYRLTPQTASAAFITLHTGEAMHRFATMIFGVDVPIDAQATGGVSDDGRALELSHVQQTLKNGFDLIARHIETVTDEGWQEIVPTPFGDVPRMSVLQFLMHHNSYHSGQIAQAIKKGKEYPVGDEQAI